MSTLKNNEQKENEIKNNYTVYMHISPSNKKYIGVTGKNVNDRWRNGTGYRGQKYFYNAIQKYGWDNFEHIILNNHLSKEEAYLLESKYISEYSSNNHEYGYNISSGGIGGCGLFGELNGMYGVSPKDRMDEKTYKSWIKKQKACKHIENYNKLLVTLSLEFLGDYQNAKDLYNQIELNSEEKEEYKSITAIIETFINKENSSKIIDELIANSPEDEYLRFAILSFFQNNETDISNEEEIKIISSNINETIKLNGMTVKTYVVNNKELDTIKFETNSNDIIVRYYYQTLLENIESENISEDMSIKIIGNLKKNSTIYLQINCNDTEAKELRIALPNSLRLANTENLKGYWIMNNAIDYISVYKQKGYSSIKIPLIVTLDGNYKFENIVNNQNGIYHISNSLDLDIK